jgi:GT2 family glycosyltransferase
MNYPFRPTHEMNTFDATIVICTYNRAAMLAEALASLGSLRMRPGVSYEILVVDNASTDETPQVVASLAQDAKTPLRRVCETRRGVAAARNRGIDEAHAEWIAFFDDDQLADPDWLQKLLDAAAASKAWCVGGAVRVCGPDGAAVALPPVCRQLLGEKIGGTAGRYGLRSSPGTGNLLVHRSVFERVGRFDESLQRGEDTDLFIRMRRAGIECWYTPEARIDHRIPATRLEPAYFVEISRGAGASVVPRDVAERGRAWLPLLWLLRLGKNGALQAPRLAWARIRGDADAQLAARCRLALAAGYTRAFAKTMFARSARTSSPSASGSR